MRYKIAKMATKTTTDHGEILHWAGFHHLFPVRKKGGAPGIALQAESGPDDERIGWDAFFAVVNHERLAAVLDTDEGATGALLVPAHPKKKA